MLANIWHAIELKLPLILLIFLVWWFIKEEPQDPGADEDGGQLTTPVVDGRPHGRGPRPRRPRPPRRGPHGDPAPSAPQRIRIAKPRPRVREHH